MKLYNFNMERNGHHLDFAQVRIRNIIADCRKMGREDAVERW